MEDPKGDPVRVLENRVMGGRFSGDTHPAKRVRDGWRKASQSVAASGDDKLILPEFPNDEGSLLRW